MSKSGEITLFNERYTLGDITQQEYRSRLATTLKNLDQKLLTEKELREYFDSLKIVMGAFIQRVSVLELNITELRRDQVTAEARMEAMYLKAQLEIQELRNEISEIKLSKGRINQIVKVAKALQGNAYAPYAVKSLVDGVINPKQSSQLAKLNAAKLPSDFTKRLEFAEQNGFKWNQNNRIPSKPSKQIEILEEWENQFCSVKDMDLDRILDKSFITKQGPGAIAGALMFLERELGAPMEERKTLSVYNCYQRAVKLYVDTTHKLSPEIPCRFDLKMLVRDGFCAVPIADRGRLLNRLKTRNLTTLEQVISGIKRISSKNVLPTFISYAEEDDSDVSRVYAVQSGKYDSQIEEFVRRYESDHQD